MQYALLIYTAEPTEAPPPDQQQAEMDGYNAFTEHVRQNGAYKAGEALDPTSTATTVRVRDGKTLTTDGPYAETKEALGGFYIVEAADLDEAIAYAAMIPGRTARRDRGPPGLRLVGGRRRGRPRQRPTPTERPPRQAVAVDRGPPTTSSTACSARNRGGRSRP